MSRTITRKHAATLEGFGFNTHKVARENRRLAKAARDHRQIGAEKNRQKGRDRIR